MNPFASVFQICDCRICDMCQTESKSGGVPMCSSTKYKLGNHLQIFLMSLECKVHRLVLLRNLNKILCSACTCNCVHLTTLLKSEYWYINIP